MTKACLVGILLLLLGGVGLAQQAGFKDLTSVQSRVPAEHVPGPPLGACPTVKTHVQNGALTPALGAEKQDAVEFTIDSVSPLHIGGNFTATVRLKNIGTQPLLIPWETDGERVTRVSEDGQKESYQATDIALILKSPGQRPAWLDASAVLFAHPEVKASYLEVPPGQWAEIKINGKLACGEEELPCGKIAPEKNATLTAWWYERELTHQVHDCNEDHGNFVIREMDAKPLPVTVSATPAEKKSKEK